MKFWAMFKKEFREILPWVLLACVGFLLVGYLDYISISDYNYGYCYRMDKSPENVAGFKMNSIHDTGVIIFFVSGVLGAAVAFRQFWWERINKTQSFTFHRSITAGQIFMAKILSTVIAYALLFVVWCVLFSLSSQIGHFKMPASNYIFLFGSIKIFWGIVIYLGMASSALSFAKWYTTKFFCLLFAFLAYLFIGGMGMPLKAFVVVGIIIVVFLLWNLLSLFFNKELQVR